MSLFGLTKKRFETLKGQKRSMYKGKRKARGPKLFKSEQKLRDTEGDKTVRFGGIETPKRKLISLFSNQEKI